MISVPRCLKWSFPFFRVDAIFGRNYTGDEPVRGDPLDFGNFFRPFLTKFDDLDAAMPKVEFPIFSSRCAFSRRKGYVRRFFRAKKIFSLVSHKIDSYWSS